MPQARVHEGNQRFLPPTARFLFGRIRDKPRSSLRRIGKRVCRGTGQVHSIRVGEKQPVPCRLRRPERDRVVLSDPTAGQLPRFENVQLGVLGRKLAESGGRSVRRLIVDDNYFFNLGLRS